MYTTKNALMAKCNASSRRDVPSVRNTQAVRVVATVSKVENAVADSNDTTRRELVLRSVNVAVLGALFTWGAAPQPSSVGVQDYNGFQTLSLCPTSPNCVSTSEEANDMTHYVPPWTYNPEEGRGRKNPATPEQAMQELVDVVNSTQPDGFTPTIKKQTQDYLHVEYESPTFGFIDDFEAFFPKDRPGIVEYRSASRIGESDGDINRKRIKALRLELQKKGWKSVGF
jgi:uncharacterized protein (DUF1499 family)